MTELGAIMKTMGKKLTDRQLLKMMASVDKVATLFITKAGKEKDTQKEKARERQTDKARAVERKGPPASRATSVLVSLCDHSFGGFGIFSAATLTGMGRVRTSTCRQPQGFRMMSRALLPPATQAVQVRESLGQESQSESMSQAGSQSVRQRASSRDAGR